MTQSPDITDITDSNGKRMVSRSIDIVAKLAKAIADFSHYHNDLLIEGELWIGTTLVWKQQAKIDIPPADPGGEDGAR